MAVVCLTHRYSRVQELKTLCSMSLAVHKTILKGQTQWFKLRFNRFCMWLRQSDYMSYVMNLIHTTHYLALPR